MSGAAGGGGGFEGFGGFGGGGFSMEDIFSQFGDIFGGHFGGSSRAGSSRAVNRGSDIRVTVKLSLAEIAEGTTKKLKINKTIACDKCGGTGAKDSSSYQTCATCNGSGYVTRVESTFFGRMQTQSVCPECGGTGKTIKDKCDKCDGEGTVKGSEIIEVRIPAGVGDGMAPTVHGKGNAARHGGINGDLLVVIEEEHDPQLVRDGNDLIHNLNITVTTAILGGGEVEVPTVDGKARASRSHRARTPARCSGSAARVCPMSTATAAATFWWWSTSRSPTSSTPRSDGWSRLWPSSPTSNAPPRSRIRTYSSE